MRTPLLFLGMINEWKEGDILHHLRSLLKARQLLIRAIRRKHYFFYEALRDGILLYDDGTFQIGKPEKLPYREIKQYAEEEYAGCFDMAEGLLRHGKLAQVEKEYKLGSFFLHQACERYYKTYMLVHSGTRPKSP